MREKVDVGERIGALREAMATAGIDAYIITGSDPHGSEYPPKFWRTREWISGFSGSAGTVLVTSDTAGLWTDFRYWIQAEQEISGSGIQLFKDGKGGVPELHQWLVNNLSSGSTVGMNGRIISERKASQIENHLKTSGVQMRCDLDLIEKIWIDRPALVSSAVIQLDEHQTGESRSSRLERLREALKEAGADTYLGIGLDSTAWLLNVRGADIPYNPLVLGFLIVSQTHACWYTNLKSLSVKIRSALEKDHVALAPYQDFFDSLQHLDSGSTVLVDPDTITRSVLDKLPDAVLQTEAKDPVVAMKARKNAIELANIKVAMQKDGLAMVRFFIQLENELESVADSHRQISELDAAAMLHNQRAALPGFIGESFSTIPAFGGHGAICHYEANEQNTLSLKKGPYLFLLDSGGQWEEGTTDITRTMSLGIPNDKQIRDYTLVLKGHIALSRLRFPKGTRGYQLDAIARYPLWMEGIDYGHGTGHGVGYRLCVHEGPQKISPAPVDVALEPGMVVSNEPGVYREDEYGIRIENLLFCREDESTKFGDFLSFETLSLAPYHRSLISIELLNQDEIDWVDAYHQMVFDRLSPLLDPQEVDWLRIHTSELC